MDRRALALLWSAFGCYDYLMTRMRNTDYLAEMMPTVDPNAVLAWIDAFRSGRNSARAWRLGAACRRDPVAAAQPLGGAAHGLSLLGAVLGLGYQALAAPPLEGMEGAMATAMPYVIIGVALALFVYARAMRTRGVLR